jgi:hypothetical protein
MKWARIKVKSSRRSCGEAFASVPKRIYTQYQAQRRIGLHRSNKASARQQAS